MKSLKRLITMILAVAVMLSSMGIVALAETSFSDIADTKVAQAVDKLVGFGIITGYEDGTFKPDNQITRAEFAAIVTRMKGVADKFGADAVTGFSDLDNDESRAWARPYVKAAVDLKIINGFEDGTFRAGEPVTYEQAVKMLVCAVGYEVVAQSELNKIKITNPNATWSAGYIAAANKHGITKGVITAKISEPAARGVVAVLTSNTLDVPELKENEDGSFEKVEEEETSQTVQEIKGIVSGTYLTGIDAPTVDIAKNEIMIGTGADKQTYELTNELRDSLDFEDLIGKNVVAYYDKFDRQITKINQRNNTTTVIKEQAVDKITGDTVKYYNANGNSESVSLSGYTKIYNGKYLANDHAIIENLDTYFKNGQIELIETGGQKIAKITSYDVFVVESLDRKNERINFKYGKKYNNGNGLESFYQLPATTSSKPIFYVNNKVTEFSSLSLSAYDVINYMESPNVDGNRIKKMYVTRSSKTEKVTAGLYEDRKVELNNTEMYFTNDYANYNTGDGGSTEEKAPFDIGKSYTYYLDYTGQIAAVKYDSASQGSYKYGYVSAAGKVGSSYVVDIVSVETGAVTRYALTKNIKIDGNSVRESAVEDTLKIAKNNILNTYTNTSDVAQPVRFEADNSSLMSIDTLSTGKGGADDNFTKQINGDTDSTVTESSVKQDGTSYKMLSTGTVATKALYVPNDVTDTSSYSKLDIKVFKNSNTKRVEVFNVGSDKLVPFIIAYGAANPSHVFTVSSPYMIVTGTSYTGDKMTITGYKNAGTSPTPITVDPEYYKGSAISGGIDNYDDENDGIKKGDLIRYIENGSKIVAIEILYDASNPTQKTSTSGRKKNLKASGDSSSKYFYYGMVYATSTESKLVALSKYIPTDSESTDDKGNPDNATYFNCESSKIYELDSSGDVAYLESLPTLTSYNKESNTASTVIMITADDAEQSKAHIVYIINN